MPSPVRFFKELGGRIAQLRTEQNLTQQQLADELGVQPAGDRLLRDRPPPRSALPGLAKALAVPIETLLGAANGTAKRGPAPKLQRQLERVSQLPKSQQRFVEQMLETVLAQAARNA